MLIDTHCHLDQFPDPEKLVAKCEAANVKVVAVTNLPSHYRMAVRHLNGRRYVQPALGFHPLAIELNSLIELKAFLMESPRVRLIGEVGLDFSPAGAQTRDLQVEVFERILDSLSGIEAFITLHSRGAENEVLDALKRYKIERACFHWYSGNNKTLKKIVSAGHFISVNPAMLRTKKIGSFFEIVPLRQLLAESDGPYAKVDRHACDPFAVRIVYEAFADKHSCSLEDVEKIIEENFEAACR